MVQWTTQFKEYLTEYEYDHIIPLLKILPLISGLYNLQDGERVSLSTCTPLAFVPITLGLLVLQILHILL